MACAPTVSDPAPRRGVRQLSWMSREPAERASPRRSEGGLPEETALAKAKRPRPDQRLLY